METEWNLILVGYDCDINFLKYNLKKNGIAVLYDFAKFSFKETLYQLWTH